MMESFLSRLLDAKVHATCGTGHRPACQFLLERGNSLPPIR
jgi:hypothetical protein